MIPNALISIIIPTYNRAHLIGETLDSILAQTYTHWECIVVDDSSTDATDDLMAAYTRKDNRFTYVKRPAQRPKGGNVCRNIGLKKAKGSYVIFFDSDDLMTANHVEVKVATMLKNDCDYCITKTKNLTEGKPLPKHYYAFDEHAINAHNYIVQNINWLTLDVCIKRELATSIRFNENLKSGQEYNYFSKLISKSDHAIFIAKEVSLRRIHTESIRSTLKSKNEELESVFHSCWETYKDLEETLADDTKRQLLYKCIKLIFRHGQFFISDKALFLKALQANFRNARANFFMMLYAKRLFNKGYYFRNSFKKQAL